MIIGIIGGSQIDKDEIYDIAYKTGSLIAQNKWVLICGGLGGVMEAAAKGAYEHQGITIGILPQAEKQYANPYITIPVASGMGYARNNIIINTADIFIAINGKYGTLNEIATALSLKKTVLGLHTWELEKSGPIDQNLFIKINTPEQAIKIIKKHEST